MKKRSKRFKVVPFPKIRRVYSDQPREVQRKHISLSLVEVDVTKARQYLREHKARTGESLSFTAFIATCLGWAVDEHKSVQAFRKGRKHLILFEEVDVTTMVESQIGAGRSFGEIKDEQNWFAVKEGHFMSTVDNKALKGVVPMASQPQEIAPGVYCLEVGKGIMRSNVYFVRSGSSWALIDTASANCGRVIQEAAESLFGVNTPPAAILLTHDHPDHAGSTPELARRWGCLVYVHPDELALVTADFSAFFSTVKGYAHPLDTWVILPLMRVMPRRHEAMLAESSFKDVARAFDPGTGVPSLPDWECIHTPGHSPGHVSFFRPSDRVLITGDAVLTVHLNSLWSFLLWGFGRNKQRLSGPPWYTTWSWRAAKESIASLAQLEPRVLACGHGLPMSGSRTAPQLRAFAQSFCGSMLEDPQRSTSRKGQMNRRENSHVHVGL